MQPWSQTISAFQGRAFPAPACFTPAAGPPVPAPATPARCSRGSCRWRCWLRQPCAVPSVGRLRDGEIKCRLLLQLRRSPSFQPWGSAQHRKVSQMQPEATQADRLLQPHLQQRIHRRRLMREHASHASQLQRRRDSWRQAGGGGGMLCLPRWQLFNVCHLQRSTSRSFKEALPAWHFCCRFRPQPPFLLLRYRHGTSDSQPAEIECTDT